MKNNDLKDKSKPSLPGVGSDWMAFLGAEVAGGQISSDTAETYKRGLLKFVESGCDIDIYEAKRKDIVNWNAKMIDAGMASATRSILLTGLRTFYKWAMVNELINVNPTLGVTAGKTDERLHKRRPLTNEEMRAIFALPLTLRNKLLVRLLAYTATRNVEIHRANLEDFQTSGSRLRFYILGKGGKERQT